MTKKTKAVSTETYHSVKRDLVQCQKRPAEDVEEDDKEDKEQHTASWVHACLSVSSLVPAALARLMNQPRPARLEALPAGPPHWRSPAPPAAAQRQVPRGACRNRANSPDIIDNPGLVQ